MSRPGRGRVAPTTPIINNIRRRRRVSSGNAAVSATGSLTPFRTGPGARLAGPMSLPVGVLQRKRQKSEVRGGHAHPAGTAGFGGGPSLVVRPGPGRAAARCYGVGPVRCSPLAKVDGQDLVRAAERLPDA